MKCTIESPPVNVVATDGMYLMNRLVKSDSMKTSLNLIEEVCVVIDSLTHGCCADVIAFDTYLDV